MAEDKQLRDYCVIAVRTKNLAQFKIITATLRDEAGGEGEVSMRAITRLRFLLLRAVRASSCEIVSFLVDQPYIGVNGRLASGWDGGDAGWTPLRLACRHGLRDVVRLLLHHHDIDPNLPGGLGWTPALYACDSHAGDKRGVVMELLATGRVDFGAANNEGVTPLMRAVYNRSVATVQAMLIHAMSPIDLLREGGQFGNKTVTEWARRSHHPDMIAFVAFWSEV